MSKVLIVGGGISGLALAYHLQQEAPGVDILVLEQQARLGGTIHTERRNGFQVEAGPNGFLDSKPSTLALCRDLGLGERLLAAHDVASRNRYLFLQGKLQRLPDSLGSFLSSSILSWRGKWQLLAERFRPRRCVPGDETVAAFARRRTGREVTETLVDALVTGIYAGDPALLSVRATFPRLVQLEERYGSIMKGMGQAARQRRAEAAARGEVAPRPGKMWSFRDGLGLLIDTLRERLHQPPQVGVVIRSLTRHQDPPGWIVAGEGQDRWPADVVVLACPAYQQALILADLDGALAERIAGIPYNQVVVAALGYRQSDIPISLDGFGYLVPHRARREVLGVQWCSSIYPERAPDGMVLLRAMLGGWRRPDIARWEDARLVTAVRTELHAAMRITAEPIFHQIIRWDKAIPQYHQGHLERVAWIEERIGRHPGLFLSGNAYHGVALNDCTEQAKLLAERVAGYLSLRKPWRP